jgi:signal transduction histidine kinase
LLVFGSVALAQSVALLTVVALVKSSDVRPMQLGVIVSLLFSAAVVAPACLWFARRITAPVDAFAIAARRLGGDPSASALSVTGPPEIRRAAAAFNDMQLRLRRYVEDRTGLMAAISHDLRGPLARIRFRLEAARLDKAGVEAELDRMEAMICEVLTFVREVSEPKPRAPINLLSLVETVIDDAEVLNAPVALTGAEDPVIQGDVQALQRALGNLVENAVKYGHRGDVSIRTVGDEAIVEVEDDGEGIGPAEREAVFKPFYRTAAARQRNCAGVGLGLAVSRSIARAHGGDITLDVRRRGLVASLRLPLALPQA